MTRWRRWALLRRGGSTAAAAGIVACASSGASTAAPGVPPGAQASRLTAALIPVSSNVRGSVDIDPGSAPNKSRVRIQLRGATVGAQHGWQVRSGRCGETTAQVIGSAAAYVAIPVRADGTADVTVTVPIALDGSQQYNVALFASRTDIDGVIACGNLTPR